MAPLPGRSPFVPASFRHGGFVYMKYKTGALYMKYKRGAMYMMYKGGAMYMVYNNCTKVRCSREVDH